MTDLILKAISGLVKIGVGAAEDKQKREAEQLAQLQAFYEKGLAETTALVESFKKESDSTHEAFEAARKRLAFKAEDTKPE